MSERVAIIAAALHDQVLSVKKRRENEAKGHRKKLYSSMDGRGLGEASGTVPVHDWVDDGAKLMRVHTYVSVLKTQLSLAQTRLLASRDRPAIPTQCNLVWPPGIPGPHNADVTRSCTREDD